MDDRWAIPLFIMLIGLLGGLLMWASGVDWMIQEWLWINYHQGFNTAMRVLGELGKGTAEMLMCLLVGIGWAVHIRGKGGRGRDSEGRFILRMVIGIVDQVGLWLFGHMRWCKRWQGVAMGPRLVIAAVSVFVLAGAANIILKMIVGRPRPKVLLEHGGTILDMHP